MEDKSSAQNPGQYFASLPKEEAIAALFTKVKEFDNNVLTSLHFQRLRQCYRAYYGFTNDGIHSTSQIVHGGEAGEVALVKVNELRSLINNVLTIATQQRPKMEPRAANTDSKSKAACKVAKGIIDTYYREKKVERTNRKACEMALVLTEGFVSAFWNPGMGKTYGVDPTTNQEVPEGDCSINAYTPFDMIRDVSIKSWEDNEWIITRDYENKYNLAAQNPNIADEITRITVPEDFFRQVSILPMMGVTKLTDRIPVYTFIHKPTPAVPRGRIVRFLDATLSLHDGELPPGYKDDLGVYRIASGDILDTQLGYGFQIDLLGLQEILDAMMSVWITNMKTLGQKKIWIKPAGDINYRDLGDSVVIESLEKPEVLDFYRGDAPIQSGIGMIKEFMQLHSGINAVSRGAPDGALKNASGSAFALLAAQAISQNSNLQLSWLQLNEDVSTRIIKLLQEYAKNPRTYTIAGKDNVPFIKEFQAEDIQGIRRVYTEMVNPVMATTAGKQEIAKDLLANGKISNANEYLSIITTGTIESMYETDERENILIKGENEVLGEGNRTRVVNSDSHVVHIAEHKNVLADIKTRDGSPESNAIADAVLTHIFDHINALKTTDPTLLMALGIQPPPPGITGEVPASPTAQPMEDIQNQPQLPNMPTNPMTGEQAPEPGVV